ncbi:MAG: threonine/serine exporter family protein [Candidatus Eremiobacteraeota bacterium]|nr:threonine/serine exporter family protein [Candidatus Eremiobacteraeota bacterium]
MESSRTVSAIQDDPKAVLITSLARELHRAGVSSDQLQQSISSAADALGLQAEILAFPTMIQIAVGPRYAQQIVVLRMTPGKVNLRKLAGIDAVFDDLLNARIDIDAAIDYLRHIDRRVPLTPAWLSIAGLGMVAFGVAVILGGGINELVVAALIGVVTGCISALAQRYAAIDRLFEVIAAFIATLIVAAYTHFIAPTNLYISIVAGVVVLLPGYSLTLALNELANQDLIAGTARLGRVFAVLLSLGCGALLGFAVVGPHFLDAAQIVPHPVRSTFWIAAAIIMSLGLSIDLDARRRDLIWVFLACFVALGSAHIVGDLPIHQIGAFVSAFICGLVANLGARFLRVPQPVFLVPALHVLVPGSLSYRSVLFIFSARYGDAASLAFNALVVGILIVAGLLLSQLIFPSSTLRFRRTA